MLHRFRMNSQVKRYSKSIGETRYGSRRGMSANPEHQLPDLPEGTVTLLFSDIEGSTALLKRLGDGWPDVLHRQRLLLREAIAAGDGVVVDCQGDAMFAAFRSAPSAVAAAAAAQRGHAQEQWPDGTRVRVRMALHTGEPHRTTDGGYTGIDVVRAARLCAAGHGGQVLMTDRRAPSRGRRRSTSGRRRCPTWTARSGSTSWSARPAGGVPAAAAHGGVAAGDDRARRRALRPADRPGLEGVRGSHQQLGRRPARTGDGRRASGKEAQGLTVVSGRPGVLPGHDRTRRQSEAERAARRDDAGRRRGAREGSVGGDCGRGDRPGRARRVGRAAESWRRPGAGQRGPGGDDRLRRAGHRGRHRPGGRRRRRRDDRRQATLPEGAEPDLKDAPAASRRPD